MGKLKFNLWYILNKGVLFIKNLLDLGFFEKLVVGIFCLVNFVLKGILERWVFIVFGFFLFCWMIKRIYF